MQNECKRQDFPSPFNIAISTGEYSFFVLLISKSFFVSKGGCAINFGIVSAVRYVMHLRIAAV
jgi:hypothetical protein